MRTAVSQERWSILLQFCCKFIKVSVCQKLWKYYEVWQNYCKNNKGAVFLPHSVVLRYQTSWPYSDGNPPPPNGGVECRWGRQSQYLASLRAVKRSSGRCIIHLAVTDNGDFITWCCETTTKCMTRSLNVTPNTTLCLRNNNKRLRTSYYFVEANY